MQTSTRSLPVRTARALSLLERRPHKASPAVQIKVPAKPPWSWLGIRQEFSAWRIGDIAVNNAGDTFGLYALADGRLARGEGTALELLDRSTIEKYHSSIAEALDKLIASLQPRPHRRK